MWLWVSLMDRTKDKTMIAAIYFKRSETDWIIFENVDYPVPRIGEYVQVRKFDSNTGQDQYMDGYVDKVDWYYSSGNNSKPVVNVLLKGQDNER